MRATIITKKERIMWGITKTFFIGSRHKVYFRLGRGQFQPVMHCRVDRRDYRTWRKINYPERYPDIIDQALVKLMAA